MSAPSCAGDADALRLIVAELRKPQFCSDALGAIRDIVRATGRDVSYRYTTREDNQK